MNLDAVSIVLVRTKFSENIGSVARAMKNMGLSRLILVDGSSPLHPNAYRLASGAEEILERAEEIPALREAVAETGCVVGTTSRGGKERDSALTPERLVRKLIPLSERSTIALVFGSEREGLTNEELSLCHHYVKIPSSESFPSLNLSQAVMVLCYELFKSSSEPSKRSDPLAPAEQVEQMFGHMEKTLLQVGFLDPNHPKKMMRTLRRLLGRSQMNEREVRILQGIWSQMDYRLKREQSG